MARNLGIGICVECGKEFIKHTRNHARCSSVCVKAWAVEYNRKYNQEYKRRHYVEVRKMRRKPINRRMAFWANIKRTYKLTEEQYRKILDEQDGRCGVCGKTIVCPTDYVGGDGKKKAYLDHDHETGEVRGLLCKPCNLALGVLGDNAGGVRRALEYLDE